jgi:hypothetical protein
MERGVWQVKRDGKWVDVEGQVLPNGDLSYHLAIYGDPVIAVDSVWVLVFGCAGPSAYRQKPSKRATKGAGESTR